jgi:RNA polymerase sigma-70 factor, ECF subfamily
VAEESLMDNGDQRILRMRPRIYNLIAKRCGNPHDAEDLTQETLIRAWKRCQVLPPTGCLESFALKIANHLIIDMARRRERRPAMSLSILLASEDSEAADCELADSRSDPAKRLLQQEELRCCLDRLNDTERRLVHLMAAGLDSKEIAQARQCGRAAVRSRVHRMRQRLQGEMTSDA